MRTTSRRAYARRPLLVAVVAALALSGQVPGPGPLAAAAPAAPQPAPATCPDARPDAAAARSTARFCGKRIEVASAASENTTVWANPDGTLTADVTAGPSRVRQGDRWVPADLTLRKTPDGAIVPAAHPRGLKLSGRAGAGEHALATVDAAGDTVSMRWSGPLPEPVLNGARATYRAVRPGVDLVVEATSTGFDQFLVVHTRAAAAKLTKLTLPLVSRSLKFVGDGPGSLSIVDPSGAPVGRVPTPLMWDAQGSRDGGRIREKLLGVAAESRAGGVDLALEGDAAWLSSPETQYPVTIDPSVTINPTSDTYVKQNDTVDRSGANDLQLGKGGGVIARSFLQWDTSAFAHGRITSASLKFWNFWSASCTAAAWEIWTVAPYSNPIHWTSQPALLTREATSTETKGYSTTCDDNWVGVDATAFFQRAATAGVAKAYMGVKAADETDNWKQFRSLQGGSAVMPRVTVTYAAAPSVSAPATTPSTGGCVIGSGRPFTSSATPRLSATVSDPDTATVTAEFEWWVTNGAKIGGTTVGAAAGATVAATVAAGAFADGGTYSWRARATDGTNTSPWSAWCEFTVDTTAPAATPTAASAEYPEGEWSGGAGKPGTFSLGAAGTADVVGFVHGLDTNPPTAEVAALGGAASVTVTPAGDGPHTLFVRAKDRAGNLSPTRAYAFYAGTAAVLVPTAGDVVAGTSSLQGQAPAGATGVTYHWRRADTDDWRTIPAGDVTIAAGGGAVAWPAPVAADGTTTKVNWDVARTLGAGGGTAADGPVQVRAAFSGGGTSGAARFTFDRDQGTAATSEVGPGTVNLVTGDFSVSHTDVAAGSNVGVTRTYSTRQADGLDPMFGPGWTSSLTVANSYTKVTVSGTLVQVDLAKGGTIGFTQSTSDASGATFAPQPGAENLTLTYKSATDAYTLRDTEGTSTAFTRPAGAPSGQYMPTSATADGSAGATAYSWEQATVDGVSMLRPTRVLAPVPAGVSCAAGLVRGCRALEFAYAGASTATAEQWGDRAGRLSQVSLTAWDPDAGRMATVVLVRYAYDTAGRLRSARDPRLDWTDGGTTRQVAQVYEYGQDGLLSVITPPAQAPWRLSYTAVPGDAGAGRLAAVSRTGPAGEAKTTVVYRVAVSGAGAPHDLSTAQTSRWGQQESPVTAAAVFPPTQVPDGDQAAGTLPSSFAQAALTYLDADGRAVNTVAPGGHTSTTWHDARGNAVRSLTAANRATALATASEQAALAARLSTVTTYTAGNNPVETLGPEHPVALPDGRTVTGRVRTHVAYDEGAPQGQTPGLPTTTTTGVRHAEGDADLRVTKSEYDWTTSAETGQTVDPGGLNLVTRTAYDADGRIASRTVAGGAGSTATPDTRVTLYYRSGTGAGATECDNRPEWAGLVCRTGPGGQAATGPEVPVTVTTYDLYNQVRTLTERTSAGVLRVTDKAYDAAGRLSAVSVTGMPVTRTVYDEAGGLPLRTESDGGAVTKAYDAFGRVTAYTDADGNTTRTEFDAAGRVSRVDDGKAVRSYTYDARGLVTGAHDSQAGQFQAEHDADGRLVRETWPTGVVVTRGYAANDVPTSVRYERPGCGQADCTLWTESAVLNAHSQRALTTSSFGTQTAAFDKAGRTVTDSTKDATGCVSRVYALDADANRTGLTTFGPAAEGACQTTTASGSRTWTYDSADRVTGPGYAYDALGRTTTVPAADAAGGEIAVAYHGNDMAKSITQGSRTSTFTLDVGVSRVRSWTDGTVTRKHHYGSDSDSPLWTDEGGGVSTRMVPGTATPVATWSSAAGITWQLTNLHGDFVAGVVGNGSSGLAYTAAYDQYGATSDAGARRYGWLGARERAADNPGGLVLMGARVYNPTTGRFLSVDPVYGGSANPYDYCSGNPANCTDVDGLGDCKRWWIFKICGIVINVGVRSVLIAKNRCSWWRVCGDSPTAWLRPGQWSKRYWEDTDAFRWFGAWVPVYDGWTRYVSLPWWGWS
ncbi:RHS repeat-associated core domain-containing protein [Actinokineospora alba]|uniref:RHS repeat-associated core domain-containing protein n=1 Tax=Actinokineospora alba TaxID=504798 RepID=A0A1H0QP12_9PSEU|nr:DNRLRE domain-containing protein [Actinokineospora alba]TDP70467.1 RHS repeat-associated protein [Actinokineospora alba]SDI30956.1 RHS repeat-associated core domain-containing protein [Actinokineospora alba]SDP18930.1 RHS repeat-associated core domain-containing protein [Actinokineospora alba]